jgi:hypothetical protein
METSAPGPSGATGGSAAGGGAPAAPAPSSSPAGTSGSGAGSPAPSAPTPAAAPAAEPKSGASGRNADGTFRKALPGSLPGVLRREAGDEDLGENPPNARPLKPIRDKAPGAAGEEIAAPGAPKPEGSGLEQPAAPVAKFKIGDLDFDSPEHAAQQFKSLRGQFRSLTTQAAQHKERGDRLNGVAAQWKQRAEAAEAQLASGNGTGAAQPGGQGTKADRAAASSPDPNDPLGGVNMEFYQHLAETEGPGVAALWLVRETRKADREAFQTQLEQATQPFRESARSQQLTHQIASIYSEVANYEENGQVLYPELNPGYEADPEAAAKIGKIWENLGLTSERAMTPFGLHLAVLAYREWQSHQNGGGTTSTPARAAAPSQGAAQVAAAIAQSVAGATEIGGDAIGGVTPPVTRPASDPARARADLITREMDAAPSPDSELGFVVSKRLRRR